jgi:hypothetical protein
MSFVPGVTVQGETVEVVGKGIPLIIIDGREVKNQSQITALQPERIKSITVDRNPSAKYDARYRSVVHIETVPVKKQEFSAQLIHGSSIGNLYNHSETINMNHSTGAWTNFLSYKYKNVREKEGAEVFQNVWNGSSIQKNNYDANMTQNSHLHDVTFGSNLKINNKHSLDLQYLLNKEDGRFDIDGTETISGERSASYHVIRGGKDNGGKYTVNLNYRWVIDSLSRIDIFTDYAYINSYSAEEVGNFLQSNSAAEYYALDNRSKFNIYALRVEYDTRLLRLFNLNSGIRFSKIRNSASSIIDNSLKNIALYNSSLLNEYTLAAYTTLGYKINHLTAEVGLRAERNESDYEKDEKSVFNKPRILGNLFPSLSISYQISDKVQLNFGYTSKINRPQFSDLDPSVSYLSSVLYQQGNPELKHQINHTVEFGGTYWNRLHLSVGYSIFKNAIAYLIEPDINNPALLFNRPANLKKASSLDINASYNIAFGKWNANLIGNVSVPFLEYPYQGIIKTNSITKFQLVSTNTYMVSSNIILIGNFVARSRYSYLNNQLSPIYNLVLAANFIMLNGKMTLTVFGNDLLKRSLPNTYSEWGNVSTGQNVRPDSRQVGIVVRFNLNRFKSKFKQSDSNSDVLKRIER